MTSFARDDPGRTPRRSAGPDERRFVRDEGVSEVVGFILSFALSAVFLMLALASFWTARDNTDAVVVAAEFKTLSDRVANRIIEAGVVAQEFPLATINMTIPLPQQINGHNYHVSADSVNGVTVAANDNVGYTATSTIFKLDKIDGIAVTGDVQSSYEHLTVTYSKQPAAVKPLLINIHG